MRVRVTFDSRPVHDPRGIGRYASSLLDALRTTAAPGDEVVEADRPRRGEVFHSPWIDGALLRPHGPQVVTLHDVVPLKRRSEYLRTGIRFRMRYLAVQRSARVIVPTAVVAAEVADHVGIAPERIVVIHEAPAADLYERGAEEVAAARARYRLPEDYLLWVGGLQTPDPRKRVGALARTPRELPLVLVGATKPWAHELPGVTLTGHVPDDHLAAIYSGARALVFPSDDEGFGLPTVEALACGTPVVATDIPVLREVLGDRATFVEVGDLEGLLAAGAVAARPAPAPPAWSWADAARATWRVYADIAREAG
jgi:glycosyltransferase involved in cell wall biosynthesis